MRTLKPSWVRSVAVVLALTWTASAAAQPAPQPTAPPVDTMTEIARQRYADGVAAFDAGRFDEARLAFYQAYELKKHPAVLLNLGLSELKSNHPVEGGNHLQQFLRDHKEANADQQKAAQDGIEEAKRRAAIVVILVDQPGADISVDGTLIGKSPLKDPVFVEAGGRTIMASLGVSNAMARVDAKRGQSVNATVTLGAGAAPQPEPQPGPGPIGPVQPVGPQPPIGPVQPEPEEGGREDFFHWYARKPLAWVGTGVTVAGLGLGIGFSVAASGTASDSETLGNLIRSNANDDNVDSPCDDSEPYSDYPKYGEACTALRDTLSTHDANVALAATGWALFGVGLAGTVTYVLIDYLPSKEEPEGTTPPAPAPMGATVVPVIVPSENGASLIGMSMAGWF